MRPRNVLTETNDMRRLMGLPLLSEDKGDSVKDIKKKVLNENIPAGFSLGFANPGGLTIAEEEIDETTEAEEVEDKGDGALVNDRMEEEYDEPINEIEKAQKMAEERALKEKELKAESNKDPMEDNLTEQDFEVGEGPEGEGTPPIDVGSPQAGDGEGGLGEPADDQVFAEDDDIFLKKDTGKDVADDPEATEEQEDEGYEDGDVIGVYSNIKKQRKLKETNKGSFAKYDITLDESWFDKDEGGEFLHNDEYSNDGIKKDVKRIISFLTPGEGDEIEGKYMDNIYPAMALQTAEILYGKL